MHESMNVTFGNESKIRDLAVTKNPFLGYSEDVDKD